MEEEFVTCINCGREVPKTQFCIFCGQNLVRFEDRPRQAWERPEVSETTIPPQTEKPETTTEQPTWPSYVRPVSEPRIVSITAPESDPEINRLTKEILNYYKYIIKLCEILSGEGLPQKVFSSIYEDYRENIRKLRKRRDEKWGQYKERYQRKKEELESAELELDELRIRVNIGEIDESDLVKKAPRIEERIETIKREVSRFEKLLKAPDHKAIEVPAKEIIEHENKVMDLVSSIEALVSSGRISKELGERLNSDLENLVEMLSSLVRGQEGTDLRDELEMLEARFKVGELSASEFKAMKEEVVKKLESSLDRLP